MSTQTLTQPKSTKVINLNEFYPVREIHHAEENHEGCVTDCGHCDRFEDAAYNGYIDGLANWYDEVGQFLDNIDADHSIGVTR